MTDIFEVDTAVKKNTTTSIVSSTVQDKPIQMIDRTLARDTELCRTSEVYEGRLAGSQMVKESLTRWS